MVAALAFYAGEEQLVPSGLGFFGANGYGHAIRVGFWNDRTYISDGAGTVEGSEVDNVKYLDPGSGILGQEGSGLALTKIPNQQATTNVRFTYDTPVRVENATLWAYDRVSVNNPPSGVTVKVAEIIHPDTVQNDNGSGDTSWQTPAGTGVTVSFCPSPGPTGLYAGNGSNSLWSDTRHDWFFVLSVSPDSIGSKTQVGLRFEVEYL